MSVFAGTAEAKSKIMTIFVSFPAIFRHDDLKQMLDSNKDHLKLEAMKRIIGMVAKVCAADRQFRRENV